MDEVRYPVIKFVAGHPGPIVGWYKTYAAAKGQAKRRNKASNGRDVFLASKTPTGSVA